MSGTAIDTTTAEPGKPGRKRRPLFWRLLLWLIVLPFGLLVLLTLLLYVPPVQDFVRGKAVAFLSGKTGTTVELEGLHIGFPLRLELDGLYVADKQGDTLLYAEVIKADIGLRALLDDRLSLKHVALWNAHADVRQYPDSTFNFNFIVEAFAGKQTTEQDSASDSTGLRVDLGSISLKHIRFDLDLQPAALNMHVELGELDAKLDTFSLDPMRFIVDEFTLRNTTIAMRTGGGEPAPATYPTLSNPFSGIDIRFNTIGLEGIRYSLATADTGDSMWVSLQRGELKGRSMDLTRQHLALKDVQLVDLDLGTVTHTREKAPFSSTTTPRWLDQHDGFRYWTQDWDLAIDRLGIVQSSVALHTDSVSPPALLLDPAHFTCSGIGMEAHDVVVSNTRIAMQLDSLGLTGGRNGERIELALRLDATPALITMRDGTVQAMGNALTFHLEAQPGELSNAYRAPEEVPVKAEVGGNVRMADLLPLLHELGVDLPRGAAASERWRTTINVTGTANHIDLAQIGLEGDQGSRVHLQGSLRDLTSWPNNTFDLTVDELVVGAGLYQVARAFIPDDVPLPARLALKGRASGHDGDLSATWQCESDLGNSVGTADVRRWKGAWPDSFNADITADHLDAARLTGDTALGPMSFHLAAVAEGLHGSARDGTLTFTPTRLSYHGNDLSSLRLNADVHGDSMHAKLTSDAEAAALELRANGRWPVAGDSLAVNMDLSVLRLHLNELGLTQQVLRAEGNITGRISLLSLDRGRVALQAPGLHLFNDDREFRFEQFMLSGLLDSDSTAVDLDCDAVRLAYHANLGLDSTVQLLRERMLGSFKDPYTFHAPPGRHIDLKVDLPGTERLASLVLPELRALELKRLEGHYDSDLDALRLDVDMPKLDYGGVQVNGLLLGVDATGPRLEGTLQVMRVMRDSLHLDDLVLEASNAPGTLRTSLRIRDGETDRYRIGLDLQRDQDIPVLHVQDSLILDRQHWQAETGNALFLDPKGIRAKDFILSSGAQRVELRTVSDGTHLDIAGFELATITGLVRREDSLALVLGTLEGSVVLPVNDQQHLAADLSLSGFEAMGVPMGTARIQLNEGSGSHYSGTLALEDEHNRVSAHAQADLSGEAPRVDAESDIDLGDLSAYEPLVKDYLFQLGGAAKGHLRYQQEGEHPGLHGRVAFTEARIGLVQTGSTYSIPKDTVVFDEKGISFNDFALFDATNNRFQLDGHIITDAPTPTLDLRLRTDRFQLVNSTAKDNPMFHGKLFSSMDLRIGGTAITPSVKGDLGVLDSTDLSVVLPGSQVELIDHQGVVQFTADFDAQDTLAMHGDSEILRDSLAAQLPGIDLDLRIKLDRNARFAVVIDPTTGDQATFRGEADLVFRYDPEGDIYLQGPFTVVDGGYTVEFYGLVKKRFELVPGGTIIWDGDPLAGRMDVQARYSTTAAPYPLVANARGGLPESERNSLQARLPFDVLINIRDAVQAPTISFGLDMDRQVRNSYPQVNSVLDQLAKSVNQEELNRQVFGLLVLNTFIENETGTEQGGSSLATTAARNSVNSILTQQLNRLTGQGIKGMDIQLGVNTYDQTEGGENYARTTVDYKVTQHILNDRVSIEAGGSMGADEHKQDVSAVSNTRAPQYAIAYDITEDGRLRLRVYHENAYDLYDGELVNNGVAIMLTRDFEKHSRERERQRKEITERRKVEREQKEQK